MNRSKTAAENHEPSDAERDALRRRGHHHTPNRHRRYRALLAQGGLASGVVIGVFPAR